jgi:hypothetical protein
MTPRLCIENAKRFSIAATLLAAGWLVPGSASASSTSTSFFVSLPGDIDVMPDVMNYTKVLSTTLALVAGESRRVSDRLGATISTSEGAEVGNRIVCLDPSGNSVADTSSGANHGGSGQGELGLMESLLLTAKVTGTYTCEILVRTNDEGRTNFVMTAVRGGPPFTQKGTWLRISSADEIGSRVWANHECNSDGSFVTCVYLGGSGDPRVAHLFTDQDTWTAATDTTDVDVVGTFQITSCPNGTQSCTSPHWGDDGFLGLGIDRDRYAEFQSFLELNQLNPDGSVCEVNQSNDDASPSGGDAGNGVYYIPDSVHHLPVSYHLTARVSPNCNGSRRFVLDLYTTWWNGNPIKLDNGGFNVIQKVHGAAITSVPKVVGMSETQAANEIKAAGLQPVTVWRLMNPAPVGTVFALNSPSGTVEPTGSEVDLSISLGQTAVPTVVGFGESAAVRAITAAGLAVGQISTVNSCIDKGLVQLQNPRGEMQVTPGTAVSISVASCNSGSGNGPPIHPK